MTNFEKYKDAVLNIVNKEDFVAIVNDKPIACSSTNCMSCKNNNHFGKCAGAFIEWLYEEYEEKPKLSERAYHFLKSLPNNARIKRSVGLLYMNVEESIVSTYYDGNGFMPLLPLEPDLWYEVSELLKWEVEG